jgi:hypothetical protein
MESPAVSSRRRTAAAALAAGPSAVGLGLLAHLLGGGTAPPVTVVLALTALVSLLAAGLTRLRLPSWVVGVASGLVQQVLHLLLTALAGAGGPLISVPGHVHQAPAPQFEPAPTQQFAQADLHVMVVTHLGAAVAAALIVAAALRWAAKPRRDGPASSGLELA